MEQIQKLLKIIEGNHGWKNKYKRKPNCKPFKYVKFSVDFNLDTRDMQIWNVTFRTGNDKKSFRIENENDYQELLEWLDS